MQELEKMVPTHHDSLLAQSTVYNETTDRLTRDGNWTCLICICQYNKSKFPGTCVSSWLHEYSWSQFDTFMKITEWEFSERDHCYCKGLVQFLVQFKYSTISIHFLISNMPQHCFLTFLVIGAKSTIVVALPLFTLYYYFRGGHEEHTTRASVPLTSEEKALAQRYNYSSSFLERPRIASIAKIFIRQWLPIKNDPKAHVVVLHGLHEHSGTFLYFCISTCNNIQYNACFT